METTDRDQQTPRKHVEVAFIYHLLKNSVLFNDQYEFSVAYHTEIRQGFCRVRVSSASTLHSRRLDKHDSC